MTHRLLLIPGFAIGVACLLTVAIMAQEAEKKKSEPPADSPPIAAVVNGEPLYLAELESKYASVAKERGLDTARTQRSKAEMLDQLINRRLATQALERVGKLVTDKEMEAGLKKMEIDLRKKKVNLQQYARAMGVSENTIRKDLFWQLAWDRYLDRNLADALEEYFDRHKKELDGTQVRASHILLRPEKFSDTPAQLAAQAAKLRAAVEAGKITFEQAALKFSAGPSREHGGDLGFFPRHGVMAEEFAKAAFALDKGQLSQPVETAFGTHLIRLTDVKPGTLQWTQVVPQIKALASAELLDDIALRERKTAKIEFTGLAPYFRTDDHELVLPKPSDPAAAK